jgi:phosphatidylglycerophosphatase A
VNSDKLAIQIATLFGAGNVGGAPGTVGSLLGLMIYVITFLSGGSSAIIMIFAWLLVFSIWSSAAAAQHLRQKDPSCVVIDEVVGMWVTLIGTQSHGPMLLAGFLLFRVFDIFKPFPIRKIESLPGGWGIVLDDVMAGVYANLVLRAIMFFWLKMNYSG